MTTTKMFQITISSPTIGRSWIYRDSGLDRFSKVTAEMLAELLREAHPKHTITIEAV